MGVKSTIRRLLYGNTTGDKLDNTPIELPVGHHKLPSAARELQEQIAIQIALKQASEGADNLQTIGEIEAELEALETDDETRDWPEVDYIDMVDEYVPPDIPTEPSESAGAPTETEGVKEEKTDV